MNPLLLTDFYKVGHPFQYPPGTETVYSNLTPRKSRMPGVDHMVFFGLQYFVEEYLIRRFDRDFFDREPYDVLGEYRHVADKCLGGIPSIEHIRDLYRLGYLPIRIKALREGTRVPMRVPCLTIENTLPSAYWLTNFLECLMSCILWQPCTSATIADAFRAQLDADAAATGTNAGFVPWQGHDFSFRGMSSLESAVTSGMGHLTSFRGTDTIPAILGAVDYYRAGYDCGGSVPATEHSVMCAGSKDSETETFRRLVEDVYPNGIVSIVSDTWDLWSVLTKTMPALKDKILQRDGKVVIRPDSGDPADILCGQPGAVGPAGKGVVRLLDEVFGSTLTSKGYKMLNPKVGAIYGDSINLARAKEINGRLREQGYASQVVFGIGSYTYQYNTRDTFGTAIKATEVTVGGVDRPIFKDPITDDGTKRSATGRLAVVRDGDTLRLVENTGREPVPGDLLETVFEDGAVRRHQNLIDVRKELRPW